MRSPSASRASSAGDPPEKLSRSPFAVLGRVLRGEEKPNHVALVLQASLTTNVLIVLTMTAVAIASHSLALLSALVENMVDLFVQGLLWYAGTRSGTKQDYAKYPAGTSRFEPVAIIVAASVMVLAAVVFIQEAITKLVDGFTSGDPEAPTLSTAAIVIASTAVTVKVGLILYARWILKTTTSAAVDAIRQDNLNDTLSNSFAIAAYIVAAVQPDAWYVDPAGAMLIFLYIMFTWGKMAWEQVAQLVGVTASEEFIQEVRDLCNSHHPAMKLDIVRAYHFGSKYLVELEVVVPAEMPVKTAHDIALQMQFKVENLEEVERAFVHVDYQERNYDEHVVSHEEDALVVYAGYDATCETSGQYVQVPTEGPESLSVAVAVDVNEGEALQTPTATSFHEMKA